MKNLVVILLAFVSLSVFGQREIIDTIQGAETVNFSAMVNAGTVQVLCEDDFGGTSDGLIRLQGSNDNVTYSTLVFDVNDQFVYTNNDNDSLTIVDNATWLIDLDKLGFPYYRITGTGTSGDTTKVTIKWSK